MKIRILRQLPVLLARFPRMFFVQAIVALACVTATGSLAAQTYTYTVLDNFYPATSGSIPSNLIQASDLNLYGTALHGGSGSVGIVFKTPLTANDATSIYSFCSTGTCTDGSYPQYGLTQGIDGNFYGTTSTGGANNGGTAFKVTPAGDVTTLYSFCALGGCDDGYHPYGLTQGTNGNFYGLTGGGGTAGDGTIFEMTPAGAVTTLHMFCGTPVSGKCLDGNMPLGNLVQASDGNFYGTAFFGGANTAGGSGGGAIYKITPSGTFTVVYSFCSSGGTSCTDGSGPNAGLIEGADGRLYGTTAGGGNSFAGGTVYAVNITTDALTTLYSFCTSSLCHDGGDPSAPLFLASDGNFYTITNGGTHEQGAVIRMTPTGTETVEYGFCSVSGCADGGQGGDTLEGQSGVIQGSDGNLYGATYGGGDSNNDGVLFQLAVSPVLAPPVKLMLSSSTVTPGASFTLSYLVSNAYSDTLQYCFATTTPASNSTWKGVLTGKPTTQMASLTAPTTDGTYIYTLTCGGQESNQVTLTVAGSGGTKVNTTTTETVTPNPVYTSQNVTVTATVKKTTGSGTPTGNVIFSADGDTLATVALNGSGVASFTSPTSAFPAGTYALTAAYQGDNSDKPSTSSAVNVILKQAVATTTKLTSSATTVTPPASVTFTATVTSSSGTPTGSVQFYAEGQVLGPAIPLNGSGVATITGSSKGVTPGTYSITAKYTGATTYAGSTSNAVSVTVK